MKSKSNFLVLVALVFSVYCCSSRGDISVYEIIVDGNIVHTASLNGLKSDTVSIAISSFVEYCILVQLETKEGAFVVPSTPTITDRYIGIKQFHNNEPYKLFDRSGKFLQNIGSFGGGPGEYQVFIWDDVIDDENELIYLTPLMTDKILVYNTSGQFVKEIVAPRLMTTPSMILSDNILSVVHMTFNDETFAIQFDVRTGEILSELVNLTINSLNQDVAIYSTRNVPNILDFFSIAKDMLYHFDFKNNTILPVFTTEYSFPDIVKLYYQLNKDIIITHLVHFSKDYSRHQEMGLVATDLKHKTSSFIRVVNDYFGNIPVPISEIGDFLESNLRNGYLAYSIQPEELMEVIKNRLTERGIIESDRQILTKALSTLKEGANNVVFIGKLKSEVKTKLW